MKSTSSVSISCTSNPLKIRRDPSLDKHVVKQNKIRFVQKLKTLLLSKPKHFMPLYILNKCRSYLSFPKPRSILSMVHRYPTVFEVFTIPTPPLPLNATKPLSQVCIRLTPAAAELARKEIELKKVMSDSLAIKLQKLLMLATHHRLLLYKLVHLAPDLGLPINFHTWLCNKYPERFKLVQTSYGHALELVTWDIDLANKLPKRDAAALDLIVDRPLKFKHLRLRKGMNIKRRHQEFLMKFEELPDVCPYETKADDFLKESLEAEKRACAVVREVLGMTIEKRTLVDHLTHFRKDFGLPNKLRGMLVRHPELFYVSLKGQRDSVFLVEGYDDKGVPLEKDEMLVIRNQLLQLVNKGHKMRKEKRNSYKKKEKFDEQKHQHKSDDEDDGDDDDYDYIESLDDLFDSEDFQFLDDESDDDRSRMNAQFWATNAIFESGIEDPGLW
ncbi:OLC1v1025797C1 [Oldenlandia corymbosa var. corymbosa]|uniref:OLC1v1025797C1 n=1 Tax=Oldenlandia corymbosa var. corymbosa TaxID=529605 RepID=A0AAV1C684_OLDCO|nr:OLC1v1025797C1 [Oldenlandia corymbosa var. corymbosa]